MTGDVFLMVDSFASTSTGAMLATEAAKAILPIRFKASLRFIFFSLI